MLASEAQADGRIALRQPLKRLAMVTLLLLVCFGIPCLQLLTFSLHSELFSYIPLIPFISGYLIWSNRQRLVPEVRPCWPGGAAFGVAGAALIAGYWIAYQKGILVGGQEDYLALMALSLLCFFWGACLALLGPRMMGQVAFPAAFLVFAVPLPISWLDSINTFFQYTSAATAVAFLRAYGTAVTQEGLNLRLPGDFAVNIAPECSGIHSTMVLFITAWIAGYMFLNRAWPRAVLVLMVIPLAILRNGFRIFVIAELCVHISHEMIHSPIHRKGGPLFFALSLIPFLLFLMILRRFNSTVRPPLKTGLPSNL
jgi:exosortase C (VPDSG-CTERM-specific)